MVEVSYHPEAEAEIEAAAAWYMSRSQTAAAGLAEELDRVIAMIQQFPELQPAYDARHRFAVLRRYPYSVVYRLEGAYPRARVRAFSQAGRVLAGSYLTRPAPYAA